MFCPKCGEQVNDNDQFCSKCGADVNTRQEPQMSQNGNKNWGKYFTQQNIEYLVAAVSIFPFVLITLGGVLGFLSGMFIVGFVFKVVKIAVCIAIAIVVLGACGGIGYLMAKDRSLLSLPGYLSAAITLLSLVSITISIASDGFSIAAFITALIAFIAGLDVISRVFLQNLELASSININKDIDALVSFVKRNIKQDRQ